MEKQGVKIDVVGSDIDKKDLQERADGISKELDQILGKFELSIQALPVLTNDGRMSAKPVLVSTRIPKVEEPENKPVEDTGLSE